MSDPRETVDTSRVSGTVRPGPEPVFAQNAVALPIAAVPPCTLKEWRGLVLGLCASGGRLAALFSVGGSDLWAAVVRDDRNDIALARTPMPLDGYPALTPELPQAQAFERELFETHGIRPDGHPWLKPLRRHADIEAAESGEDARAHLYPFFPVDGPSIHEVAVGPVHAGIIEPGHFRFQCHGEAVQQLEIQLGYQHRGAEALLVRTSPARRLVVAESIAGDTAVGHALAHCMAMEALAGVEAPLFAQAVRMIALEVERLANHVGDLGALSNDVGYLPGASWLGRLRGNFLNVLMMISGNRFGRGLLRVGGVRRSLSSELRNDILARFKDSERNLQGAGELMFGSPSVGSRFEQTGVLTREVAEALGLVGPVARASGCDRDVRRDHPAGMYRFSHVPVALAESGDVMGRALVRWLEIQRSLACVREQISELPEEVLSIEVPPLMPGSLVLALVEGWRGEVVHLAATSASGVLTDYKIVDPSFHNWFGLAMAMRGNEISDFPLCNKSFNLSYAGHDL